jgi:hypothetical protein
MRARRSWLSLSAFVLGACPGSGLVGHFTPPDAAPPELPVADLVLDPGPETGAEPAPEVEGGPEAEPSPEVEAALEVETGPEEAMAEVEAEAETTLDVPIGTPCETDPDCQHLAGVCRWAACDPALGVCESGLVEHGTACDDGQPCTTWDACVEGVCGGAALIDGTTCNDQNPCSVGDTCLGGLCAGKKAMSCGDQNPCTDDLCVPGSGCLHKPNLAICEDGLPCSIDDYCAAGSCQAGGAKCDDQNPCTAELCHAGTGTCTYVPSNALTCSDASECTTGDKCAAGTCVPGKADGCDDLNPCTEDACVGGKACSHSALGGSPCSDGDACTSGDSCAGAKCSAGPKLSCDDQSPCTKDSCDSATGCVWVALPGGLCSDGDACTVGDTCDAIGSCAPGLAATCGDANPCTDEGCDPAGGCWKASNTAACDDGTLCTEGDTCALGACVGLALSCTDPNLCTEDACDAVAGCEHLDVSSLCQDGDACTNDGCDPVAGCHFTPNQAACDDGSPCTVDDTCAQGACEGTSLCDDGKPCTLDLCDPEESCVNVSFEGTCEDGDLCTSGEVCDAVGSCAGGLPMSLDDGVACTVDACTPAEGVTHTPDHAACGEGFLCSPTAGCGLAPGAKLILTKLTLVPGVVTVDGQGQWIQIQNVGTVAVDLTRLLVSGDSGSTPIRHPSGTPELPVWLAPGERAAGIKAPPVLPDATLGAYGFVFGVEGEPFFLVQGSTGKPGIRAASSSAVLDEVPLTIASQQDIGSTELPLMAGVATELDAARILASDPVLANDDAKVWCVDPHGGSGPGAPNLACTAGWLNEVSLAGGPGQRWIEIYLYAGGALGGLQVRLFDSDGEPLAVLTLASGRFPFGKAVVLLDGADALSLVQATSGGIQLVRAGKLLDAYGFGALAASLDVEDGLPLLEGNPGPPQESGKAALRPVDGADTQDNATDFAIVEGGSPGVLNAP